MKMETLAPVRMEDLGVTRQDNTLSNGTELVLFEKPGTPVYMRAVVLGGSRFDPIGRDGTSHYLEHMLAAGTQKFPTKDKLAAYIEQYGGGFSASTGSEVVNINSAVGDPQDLDVAFEVMHEMILASLFAPNTLETENASILKELGDKKSNPGEMIWEVYRRLFFQGTEVGRSTLGTEESIKGITGEDLLQFYRDRFRSGRMALVVGGGVTLAQIVEHVEDQLLLPEGTRPESVGLLPVHRNEEISVEHYSDKEQVHPVFGFRTTPVSHPDSAALTVMAEILAGGRASTLSKKLRLERGLVYSVFAGRLELSDAGTWTVKTSTSRDKLQEVVDVICDEIKRVSDSGLNEDEIHFAQRKLIKSKRMQLQSSGSWVAWHATRELISRQPFSLEDNTRSLLEVTSEKTRDVAQEYFGADRWYLGLCGDVTENNIMVRL